MFKSKVFSFIMFLAFAGILTEGAIHYSYETDHISAIVYGSVRNFRKVLALDPVILPHEIITDEDFSSVLIQTIRFHLYTISLYVAPSSLIVVCYTFLKRWVKRGILGAKASKLGKYIVFGYNENVRILIKNKEKQDIYLLFHTEDLPLNTKDYLASNNVILQVVDAGEDTKSQIEAILSKYSFKNTTSILFLHDSMANNISNYLLCTNYFKKVKNKNVRFFCCSESVGAKSMMSAYHDDTSTEYDDISLISMNQLKISDLFSKNPLFTHLTPPYSMHILLMGFENMGIECLKHILKTGVMSKDSIITIDIVAENARSRFETEILQEFNQDFLQLILAEKSLILDEPEVSITSAHDYLDGTIRINCIESQLIHQEMLQKLSIDNPFTYAILSNEKIDENLLNASRLQKFFTDTLEPKNYPCVAINLEESSSISDYIRENKEKFDNISPISSQENVISASKICNPHILQQRKQYNALYDHLYGLIFAYEQSNQPLAEISFQNLLVNEEEWRKIPFYKKDSSTCVQWHDETKEKILSDHFQEKDPKTELIALLVECGVLDQKGSLLPLEHGKEALARIRENSLCEELLALEHRRWNYFTMLEGWGLTTEKKDAEKKLSPCLISWEKLCQQAPEIAYLDLLPYLKFLTK
ncbi:MAG: hypothetical protein R3Y63_00375 [Eubacteriales bacterium]